MRASAIAFPKSDPEAARTPLKMLQLDSRFVKRGLWPNLEKGPVLGWTITTDMEKGTIVIALLAIFSSLALAHLWHLLTFCFHQLRADGRLADGLFQQQQALLRTLPTPSSMLADTLKLWWLWRKRTDRALYRSLVLTIFGIVFSAATIGVGIFSSYVVDSSNIQVLVDSPFCGPIGFDPTTEEFYKTPLRTEKYQAKVAALGRSLAEDCYQNNTFLSERCQAFIKPNITFGRQRVDCPFDPSICVDISQPAIEFDSGILDLNNDFGMNLEKKDHVKYRKKTTCAVLKTDGRYSVINASDYPSRARARPPLPSEELLLMHFGNVPKNGGWPNTTFVHSLLTANNSVGYGTGANAFTYSSPKWSLLNDLEPLPEMSVEDVDLEVVMITKNRQTYGNPVNDPIFSAHDPFEVASNIEGENETVYFSDFPNSIVGCTLQVGRSETNGVGVLTLIVRVLLLSHKCARVLHRLERPTGQRHPTRIPRSKRSPASGHPSARNLECIIQHGSRREQRPRGSKLSTRFWPYLFPTRRSVGQRDGGVGIVGMGLFADVCNGLLYWSWCT